MGSILGHDDGGELDPDWNRLCLSCARLLGPRARSQGPALLIKFSEVVLTVLKEGVG